LQIQLSSKPMNSKMHQGLAHCSGGLLMKIVTFDVRLLMMSHEKA
jgi:hypothetical protein